jgi:anti-sigma B factor antagonist
VGVEKRQQQSPIGDDIKKDKQKRQSSETGWLPAMALIAYIYKPVIFERFRFPTLSTMRDEPLTYSFSQGKSDGTTVLKLVGPLTISTMFGFQNEFRAATPQAMIVDLSETTYMDSAGLGLIMNYYVVAADPGRKLLLAGINDRIKALMEMTKVLGVLTSFPTVALSHAKRARSRPGLTRVSRRRQSSYKKTVALVFDNGADNGARIYCIVFFEEAGWILFLI